MKEKRSKKKNFSLYEKLTLIQNELNIPKTRYHKFGKYYYRSGEDILEGLKPLLQKYECTCFVEEVPVVVGERYYMQATVVLRDSDSDADVEEIQVNGFAREPVSRKGQDDAQITGSTSSYAMKYALRGMFLVDDEDSKDPEVSNNKESETSLPKTNYKEKLYNFISRYLGVKEPSREQVLEFLKKEGFESKNIGELEAKKILYKLQTYNDSQEVSGII